MFARLSAAGLAGFALAASVLGGLAPSVQAGLPANFSFSTVATGFIQPMSFAYAPDGRIFVAERGGIIKIVHPGGGQSVFLDLRAQVNTAWARGMVSLALDPAFSATPRFYLLYSEELNPGNPDQNGSTRWRVARFLARADNPDLADASTLVTLASDLETTGMKSDPHTGGDLDFDRDGHLLCSFGDGASPGALDPEALKVQDLARLHGKVIRIDRVSGNGIPANPFYEAGNPGSIRSKILARGLRQPFRIAVDRLTGLIYEGEVGWDAQEELNVISTAWTNPWRDQNYGWPCYEGPGRQPQYEFDGRTAGACAAVYNEGAKAPVHSYPHNGVGAAAIMGQVYRGDTYPGSWQGKVFWFDHNRDELWTYTPGSGVARFGSPGGYGSMVDFESAPGGNLAYLSYNEGRIREILYLGANRPPTAVAAASFVPNTAWRYNFSAGGSTDPDGDPLTYSWAFGDGTTATGLSPVKTYAFGSYDAVLTASDGRGGIATATVHIDAGNRPPVVTFPTPADNSTYAVGEVVNFQIRAQDADEGALPGDRVGWVVSLHHADHVHPDQPATGLSGSFTANFPEVVETWYTVQATARDNDGGVGKATLTLRARRVDITFASNPSGSGVVVDGEQDVTPATRRLIVNSVHSAVADATVTTGGSTYAFASWSGAGQASTDRNFSFTVPAAAATVTARYHVPAFPQVYLRGTHNGWAANLRMTAAGGNRWSADATFGATANERFKFDIHGDWTRSYGDTAPADGIADLGGADIKVTQGQGGYRITFDGDTRAYAVTKADAPPGGGTDWRRTVLFIYGQTATGQDMFVRGGIDHGYANANLGRACANTNLECAMPIRHLNLRNATTAPWKANDTHLDWYGTQAGQSAASPGSPADWTTDIWPADWGAKRTVAVNGFGEEPLNTWGRHYWMLDVEMDCSKSVNGWFEVKSFISNGPGWEPNLVQPGAPYASGNHFAKCGEVNMFRRGSNAWEHLPL